MHDSALYSIGYRSMTRTVLNIIGVAILILGLGIVAVIERNANVADQNALPETEANYYLNHPDDNRVYATTGQEIGGSFGVLLVGIMQFTGSLGHSRPFAITIAVVSFIAAGCAFTAAIIKDS